MLLEYFIDKMSSSLIIKSKEFIILYVVLQNLTFTTISQTNNFQLFHKKNVIIAQNIEGFANPSPKIEGFDRTPRTLLTPPLTSKPHDHKSIVSSNASREL